MAVGVLLSLLIPGQMIGLFTDNETTVEIGVKALTIICIGFIISAVSVTCCGALEALQKMSAPHAEVIRDGEVRIIPGREVVPGDIVMLEAGNFVPADLRLVESVNLKIEEASLTGESVPVEKNAALLLEGDAPLCRAHARQGF